MEINNPSTLAITPSGTFALRPAAAVGGYYFATDLGNYGALLHSNGTSWTPVGGSAVLYQSGAATATTNAAAETNLLVVPIPAGMLTAKGMISFDGVIAATGTTGTKSPSIRVSAISGDTAGGTSLTVWSLSSANLGALFSRHLWADNSASAQITEPPGVFGPNVASAAPRSSAIDTTAAWYVNFNGLTANAADTIGYHGITVRWIE